MMKQETINRKLERVKTALDRMECGKYVGESTEWIANTIEWLWRWGHIDRAEMSGLASRAAEVFASSARFY